MQLIAPIAHMNGTGKQSLLDQYCEANHAIVELERYLSHIETHDRDYYIHPTPNAGREARKQRDKWFSMLRVIKTEIDAITLAISRGDNTTHDLPESFFTDGR